MGRRQRRREAQAVTSDVSPAAGGRYTPPKRVAYRIRPRWHAVVGVVQVVFGLAIVVINYIDYANVRLLPGGHQEIYFVLGIMIAAGSVWWFGWFDRSPDPDEIRRQYQRNRG